ncbi:MAG: site-specific integrase [Oscillospiraceae bacterium]|nr:site-specific integrase [Oscillospiraceae bacterium]
MSQPKSKQFATWATEWLKLAKPTVKGNTFAASYKNPVEKHLIPYFGRKRLNSIKQTDIQEYISIVAQKYSSDTVKKHKHCLFHIFDVAVENDYCIKNPVRRIKINCTKANTEKYVYTAEEERLLVTYARQHRFGKEVKFLLATGISRSELLALTWQNVNLKERIMYIRNGAAIVPDENGKQITFIGETKNPFRRRDIPLDTATCELLQGLSRESVYVFCNKYGNVHNPRTWQRRHFDVFMQDMHNYYAERGIYIPIVTPHQLRHTRLSRLVNSGKNPIAVGKYGGHVDMNMLAKRYVHSTTNELREQLEID